MDCLKLLSAVALLTTACFAADQELENLHTSSNVFTINLFKKYAALTKDNNLMISPLSAYMALAMTADGAAGNTYEQLHRILDLPKKTNAEETFKKFISEFNVHEDIEVSLANAIIANEQLKLEPAFETIARNKFSALISKFDPNNPTETADKVNKWASDSTHGKINELVEADDIDKDLQLMILNAVYFKAAWKSPFEGPITNQTFYKFGSNPSQVPMMSNNRRYRNGELKTLKARFIELPYINEEYKMTIILPNKNSNIDEVIKNFNASVIKNIKRSSRSTLVNVTLPKFRIESNLYLNEPLKKLGMTDLFSERSNLTKIIQDDTPLETIMKQKSFIDVNERGSEAAAVTDQEIRELRTMPLQFKVDRPALFFISKLDTIMFIGYIKDPVY